MAEDANNAHKKAPEDLRPWLERHYQGPNSDNIPNSTELKEGHDILVACRDRARERADMFKKDLRETEERKKKIMEKIRAQEMEEERTKAEESAKAKS